MTRTTLVMGAVAFGVAIAAAQSDPIAQRKSIMKRNGQNAVAVNRMVRGEEPFDAAKVNSAFTDWEDTAQKLPVLFASPSPAGADTRALPKIWDSKHDFDAKLEAFSKAVAENKDKAKSLDGLKIAFPAVNKVCVDCHETYRRPQQPGQKK